MITKAWVFGVLRSVFGLTPNTSSVGAGNTVVGTLVVQESGGTAGTNELRLYHVSNNSNIQSMDGGGHLILRPAATNAARVISGSGGTINIQPGNFLGLGTAHLSWNSNTDGTGQDTGMVRTAAGVIRVSNGSSGNGWLQNSAGTSFVATDHTNNTTTPTAITNLSATVAAGRKYCGELVLFCDNTVAADGLRFDFDGGTATMTTFEAAVSSNVQGATFSVTTSAALATDIIATTTGVTTRLCVVIHFGFVVNAAGTFIPRAGLEAASTGVLTTRVGSHMVIEDAP